MKFLLDTANLDEIRHVLSWGLIDGVTTNPSLIAAERVPVEDQARRICDLVPGDVSVEVISTRLEDMVAEGRRLAALHPNIVVKLPLIRDGLAAAKLLSIEGVRVNMTLCFSAVQALLAAKTGAYVVSPFVGRLDDLGGSGIQMLRDIKTIYTNYGLTTRILAASLRGPLHVLEAAKAGVDMATVSSKVLEQLIAHPLTEKGLEQFLSDYHQAFQLARR
jgi:transaldolase